MLINKNIPYIGNGPYCYANATAMLLASIGENISSSLIEVLSGVGLGAFILKGTDLLFFSWAWPSYGIDNALKILGFECKKSKYLKKEKLPLKQLRRSLKTSCAVIGPLDMGYLVYNPRYAELEGSDHFVLAYEMDKKNIYLHDPAGFPYVFLSLDNFKRAWEKDVGYEQEYYYYWHKPKRVDNPTDEEIYKEAVKVFRNIYLQSWEKAKKENWIIGKEAILFWVEKMRKGRATKMGMEQLIYFALALGARRAFDYSCFFYSYNNKKLAGLKESQAILFGKAHTLVVRNERKLLPEILIELANNEEEFRVRLLA